MTDNYNPDPPTETDLINEYARNSLEDWRDEEWAERDKAAARRRIAKIKADAWDEGFQYGRRQDSEGDDGPKFVNPYRGQEES